MVRARSPARARARTRMHTRATTGNALRKRRTEARLGAGRIDQQQVRIREAADEDGASDAADRQGGAHAQDGSFCAATLAAAALC